MSLLTLQVVCLSFGQFAMILFPPSSTVRVISVNLQFVLIISGSKSKYMALLQLYLDLMFYHEEFYAVKSIAYSLACSEFPLSNCNMCLCVYCYAQSFDL